MEPAQRARLVPELAPNLAAAVRLHDAGATPAEVAAALDVPVEGVSVLLQIAEAKLEHHAAELAHGIQPGAAAEADPEIQYPTTEATTASDP
jgi:DNA-directed RNA polymerase specialized sigma24 family protein